MSSLPWASGSRRWRPDRRGLEISERLLETFGETPEALRDVSVSLNKVGDVELALGERERRWRPTRRGLEISERLLETFGETPEALRDVSVSLDRIGDVELALGERESALAAYRRGLEIRERLLETFGETPEALRDVSVSQQGRRCRACPGRAGVGAGGLPPRPGDPRAAAGDVRRDPRGPPRRPGLARPHRRCRACPGRAGDRRWRPTAAAWRSASGCWRRSARPPRPSAIS